MDDLGIEDAPIKPPVISAVMVPAPTALNNVSSKPTLYKQQPLVVIFIVTIAHGIEHDDGMEHDGMEHLGIEQSDDMA